MQGCWVMDCNRCVFLSHPSTRCQSQSSKQTHRTPHLPFRTGFNSNWTWEWLRIGLPLFLFLRWMDVRLALRPAAQHWAGTSWNRVSFRLRQGPQLWLKNRRMRDTWKKRQLIRRETCIHNTLMRVHTEEKLTCPYMLTTLGKKACHQQTHTSHKRTAFNQDGYFSCQMFVK